MSPQVAVFLACVGAGILLAVAGLVFVAIEGRRLQRHATALRAQPAAIDPAAAVADLDRLARALDQIVALSARAAIATGRLRAQIGFLNRVVRGFPGPA